MTVRTRCGGLCLNNVQSCCMKRGLFSIRKGLSTKVMSGQQLSREIKFGVRKKVIWEH